MEKYDLAIFSPCIRSLVIGCTVADPKLVASQETNYAVNLANEAMSFRTTQVDQNTSWKLTYRKLPSGEEVKRVAFFDARTGLVLSEGNLFRTFDGGETWTEAGRQTNLSPTGEF